MKPRNLFLGMVMLLVASNVVHGQHEHHETNTDTVNTEKHEAPRARNKAKDQKGHHSMNHAMDSTAVPMSHDYSLNLPMNRNGS